MRAPGAPIVLDIGALSPPVGRFGDTMTPTPEPSKPRRLRLPRL
ncbi:MAG: hypothetical protein QOK25_1647, partial [Thermoleophilaceae bacterium]|nr:hypothetical protein [Thermoleophilaceae bacterium]